MHTKNLTIFVGVAYLFIIKLISVQGCKLYCVLCESYYDYPSRYYCCMEDWEITPRIRDCGLPTNTGSTTASTTPCPTNTPPPTRCPALEDSTKQRCSSYERFNPKSCKESKDCTAEPFTECCQDICFATKICKSPYVKE